MAGITLAQAEAQLAAWLDASTKVAQGQTVEVDGRRITRADAAEIRNMVEYWEGRVQALTPGTGRILTRLAIPS